jgi:YesN/AraC family two-component response regulator
VTAPDAFEALRILRAQSDIELMITDINIPA